ncbi:MAG: Protease HtpX [Candidatus Anoxychlamydiales bacterium]|nr:Protease HtpX [Candidatus Anoxychlamydiales bacterium]
MSIIKRILLFLIVNLLVVLSISFLLSIFNIKPYINAYGLDIKNLAIFCLLWGFIGSFISLFLSKALAKWLMKVKIIDKTNENTKFILEMIKNLSNKANLKYIPEVGIYQSKEINAFATGPSQKRSLIALSSALIDKLHIDEIEAIIGHEISHIKNGDMVTMTLLQGIINSFVMFLSRILAFLITSNNKERNNKSSYFATRSLVFVFEIIFMILGSMIIALYSRKREYKADYNSAKITSKEKMIKALEALNKNYELRDLTSEKAAFQSFKISNNSKKGFIRLFATHPPLKDRIERLKNL